MPIDVYYAALSYNANSGSGAPATQTLSAGEPNYPITFTISSSKPSRTYYTFLGWAGSQGATSAAYASGGSITVNSASTSGATNTKTIYAVWKRNTAYVYYNANGGSNAPSTQSHNAGTSIKLSATIPTRNGYIFLGWATSASATTKQYDPNTTYNLYTTTTLYAVWKVAASTLTASNGNIGDAITIGITRQNNAYTDTITYSFGTATGTIVTKTGNASVTWTPPIALASEIPNSSTATCTLTCTTYNGDAVVGTTTKTITLTVPDSLAPTVSVSYADTIAQCLAWGLLVQSRSKLSFTITASGQQGATIASYSTSVNGTSYNSDTFTTDVLLYNGTNSYSVTVTDSRGKQTVSTGNFSVVAYSNPSLTLTLCDRNDSDPDQVDVAFDFSVASVSSNNDANYRLDYKLKSASIWTNGTVQSLGAYSGSISDLIANLDGGDEWDIRINVIDSFQTTSVESEVGVAGNILLNSRHQGGLGLLMKSQSDNQLDVGKPTVFHGANLEQFGSTVATHSTSGSYAKVVTFELLDANVTAPITMEFIRTGDTRPTEITFCFGSGSTLTSFTSNNVTDAYLHYASSVWTLYIGRATASDKVEILDFHNPWSNTDMTVEWDDTSISTLPTGAVQVTAIPVDLTNSYGDLANTGRIYSHAPSAVNLAASTWKTIAQLALPAGKYVVAGNARFPSNSTGRRTVLLSTSQDSSTDLGIIYTDTDKSWSDGSGYNFVGFCSPLQLGSAQTIYLNAWQNSGSALSTYGRLYVIRIA